MSDLSPERLPLGGQPEVRVSDDDREHVVAFLRGHCADGRLTLDEFADRVENVYGAKTVAELVAVTSDLPVAQAPPTPAGQQASGAVGASRTRRAVRWTVSFFSPAVQRGRWRIEGETNVFCFMGVTKLDLREAEFTGNEIDVNVFSFMGTVKIVVPEGIDVVMEGFSFMGPRSARVRDVPVLPGSPLVRVRAYAFMGPVVVRSEGHPDVERQRKLDQRERYEDKRELRRQERFERVQGRIERVHERHQEQMQRWAPQVPPPPKPRARGIEALAGKVREEWFEIRPKVAPEGTVTIMFSDIEGFTSINERLGDYRVQELLRDHYKVVRSHVEQHGGFEVKVHGDGFMIAFSSAARALRCAVALQEELEKRNANAPAPEEPLRVRMGLHTGEAIRDADDFLGSTVNLASRIADAARGDEILVSALLRELCVSTGEFRFDDGREMELKGLSQPHRVFSVQWR